MENKNEAENELIINDVIPNITETIKKPPMSWKKIIFISSIFLIIIISIIVILLIIFKNSSDNNDSNKENSEKNEIGTISCIYDISEKNEVKILGDEFNKISNFDIYINGNKEKYSKIYNFTSYGINHIDIKLYDNLNMDFMFKDISTLISVEMVSLNNTEIISMISTFENCENLESFSIFGFSSNRIKSMKKLFYNTKLNN